jgi:hypothetical protein
MCFSATASLVAGGALSATGVLTLSQAKTKRQLPLASIPLLFGIQQLIDGVVWLSFGIPLMHMVAVYAYSLFSLVLWPIFVPLAVLSVETNHTRRRVLEAISLIGLGVGAFFLYFIIFGTTTAQVVNHCVAYETSHPYRIGVLAFYIIATGGTFLVSSNKILRILGSAILFSFFIAGWFFFETFTSVWCFFAAILSALIYWYFRTESSKK